MFRINRKFLAAEMALLVSIAGQKNVIPALSTVRFSVQDDKAFMLASNGDMALFTELPAEGEDWHGCIPAKPLYDLVRLASDVEEVAFTHIGSQMQVSWGRSRHRLPVIDFGAFPRIEVPVAGNERLTVKNDALKPALERVLPCVSQGDTTHYNLKGVKLEAKDEHLILVGTNSHRVGVATIPAEGEIDVLIPTNAALLMSRLESEDVTIWRDVNAAVVNCGVRTLVTRLPAGQFPNWRGFIPKDLPLSASVNTKDFMGALKRADVTRDETFKTGIGKILLGVVLIFGKDELVIDTKHSDVYGRSEESVEIKSNLNGDLIYMGINPDYIMDFLKLAGEQTECWLKDGGSVLHLADGSSFEYFVVPQSLRERQAS